MGKLIMEEEPRDGLDNSADGLDDGLGGFGSGAREAGDGLRKLSAELPQVGPIAGRHSLEEYRRTDFVGDTTVAERINKTLSTGAVSTVFIKGGPGKDVLPVHQGDVCVALTDLPEDTRDLVIEALSSNGGTLVAIGDILDRNEETENTRARETADRILPGLIAKLDQAFMGDESEALEHIQGLLSGKGFALPIDEHKLPDVNWGKIPVSGDQRWKKDDRLRNERNSWFTNSVAPIVKESLRRHFIENILPRFEGKVYWRDLLTSYYDHTEDVRGRFVDGDFMPNETEKMSEGSYHWERDFAEWCMGVKAGKLEVFFNLEKGFKYVEGHKYGHVDDCGQAFVVGFANSVGNRNSCGVLPENNKVRVVDRKE